MKTPFKNDYTILFMAVLAGLSSAVISYAIQFFIPYPFVRIWTRVFALIFIILLVYDCKRSSIGKKELGLDFSNAGRKYIAGFLSGFLSLVILLSIFCFFRLRYPDPEFHFSILPAKIGLALLTGIAISTFEEIIFRGYMYSKIKMFRPERYAFWITIIVFASIHLVKPLLIDGEALFPGHLPAICGIFVVSYILMDARIKTGSLLFSMGIHTAWVFVMKADGIIIDVPTHYNGAWFNVLFGSTEYFEGGLVSCAVLVLLALFLSKRVYPLLSKGSLPG
ncbi:MAG: CPBP family intramembrane metalloprotease [Candidatus Aureabacteria bacterium]|nr:CPBP family intramembrane metalloprotease [Candidatus Auribacterota bacterium]